MCSGDKVHAQIDLQDITLLLGALERVGMCTYWPSVLKIPDGNTGLCSGDKVPV